MITHVTDDVVDTWKAMPLMFGYDKDRREFVAIKNYHINNGGTRLSQHLSVTKDLVDAVVAKHGEKKGMLLIRKEVHKTINKRIEELYKGKNKPIPTE